VNQLSAICAAFIWRHRWLLAAIVVGMTMVALQQTADIRVSNSLSVWYPDDDPELQNYRRFQETYGSDEIIVVAVRGDTRFDTEAGIDVVAELTDRFLDLDGVATVTSLVTVPESLAGARGRLLGTDGLTTALIVQTLTGPGIESMRGTLLEDLRAVVAEAGLESFLGGYGVVFEALNEASTTGAATLIVIAHVFMVLVLAFMLRSPGAVALTLVAVGMAAAWTMGLYGYTGHQLNMVTMVLPTLVLVIGIADCLHVLRAVAAQPTGQSRDERVTNGLAEVIGPCFLMTITTAAGFLGLTFSGLPVVQELGWFGATGVAAAFFCSMTIITAGLTWKTFEPRKYSSFADRLARRLYETGTGYPRAVISGFVVVAAISGYGVSQLSSDTDSIGYMKPSHVVRQDSDFIEAEIGPYVPVEFTLTVDDSVFDAAFLDAVWDWQRQATAIPGIGWSWSLLDALGVGPDQPPSAVGLQTLRARFERMRRFSPTTVAAMISGDTELRISFGAPIMSARSVRDLTERIEAAARDLGTAELQPAGYSPLYTRIVDEIVDSQVRGFGAAIVMIVLLIGIAMGSWRRMLLALPANALPVLFTLGLMGLTGIPLDVASATIASVILGLVVDDTVHLLRPGRDAAILASMETATERAGGTLVMTSVVLAAGFLVLGLAEIRSIAWFGVLTSFAVVVAIVADLTVLPAIARLCQMKRASH
jgi:predicted RND superfamily exporter protein